MFYRQRDLQQVTRWFCKLFFLSNLFFTLTGCYSTEVYAPVINAWQDPCAIQSRYRVQQDDTVYSIACAFDLDYRDLAQANHLSPPYHLQPGQTLTMVVNKEDKIQTKAITFAHKDFGESPPTYEEKDINKKDALVVTNTKKNPSEKKDLDSKPVFPKEKPSLAQLQLPEIELKKMSVNEQKAEVNFPSMSKNQKAPWVWPVVGKIIHGFNLQYNGGGNKGIDIAGEFGSPIHAVSSGQVVYCGTGLRGYGNLVIIKHDMEYLTLYGHNSKLLVKEGDVVKLGSPIAKMGRTNTGLTMLHFEIRRYGKPVNPLSYIKPAQS